MYAFCNDGEKECCFFFFVFLCKFFKYTENRQHDHNTKQPPFYISFLDYELQGLINLGNVLLNLHVSLKISGGCWFSWL